MQFKILEPLSRNPDNLMPELTCAHINLWTGFLRTLVSTMNHQQNKIVFLMNTYFYTKLNTQKCDSRTSTFQEAEKWILKAYGSNADILFERKGKLTFAIHVKGNPVGHFFLAEVDFEPCEIRFMDSIPDQDHSTQFEVILKFITYLQSKYSMLNAQKWQRKELQTPTQQNGYDCGVFTILFMSYTVASFYVNKPIAFPFDQSDVDNTRYAMTLAFLERSLIPIMENWFIDFYTTSSDK
jgi:Ulp1 family protease